MKYFALLLVTIIITGCGAQNYTALNEHCPEGGTCTFEILKDKAMQVGTGVTGKLHYTLKDEPGTNVAVYKYTKTTSGQYQDNFYNEEIVFEFTGDKIDPATVNKDNVLFGVGCYCKGKAGHYSIENPVITQKSGTIAIQVPEIIDSQILHTIQIKKK